MTDAPVLLCARDGLVATLTLNRPASRNALSLALIDALDDALARLAADPAVAVIVIAGAGPAFCAGHDLKELRSEGYAGPFARRLFADCSRLMQRIAALPKPVIAQVHGMATAAGCQLVASCDLAVAAADARFATPGVDIGLFCSTPMVALTRNVGAKVAMRMLLTGEAVDAHSARALGLVSDVVAAADLARDTAALAARIATKSPRAIALGKLAFHRTAGLDLAAAYADASEVMLANLGLHDAQEGIAAFLERRAPVWAEGEGP